MSVTNQIAAGFEPEWIDVVTSTFMRNAFLGGTVVALASGLIGYFVIIRSSAFAAHALAHIGFPGATGALLVGAPISLGLLVFCAAGGVVIGVLGDRASQREVATGTVLAFASGLGILFASLATQGAATVTSVLFGNLLAIKTSELVLFAGMMFALVAAIAIVFRPLRFASLDPLVAEAKGLPVRTLSIVFMLLLALVITMAVQVVGTLLLFGLVVTPAATAFMITARPAAVIAIGSLISIASVWFGLTLSAMFNLPPSFFVIAVATLAWLAGWLITRRSRTVAPAVPAHS
ncbi:MAG: metal ABC transporter permease [Candidatus Nanopelagicales bacterium]|nr:metal ABC transporter permease [Candidatus Nanopelagicales bacterium]